MATVDTGGDNNPRHTHGGHAGARPNRLMIEKSPYLLQHAYNPVDWYPWGEEAFAKARRENKLIFLSVGYSTCHWCHVMERESFESDSIAAVMNQYFVNIKVDREERPDVDRLYMSFVVASTGHGGWPMSVWLTPDLKPVFGGTYFAPEGSFGRPGFRQLLEILGAKWHVKESDLKSTGESMYRALKKQEEALLLSPERGESSSGSLPPEACLPTMYNLLESRYEEKFGGFGFAPKFPQPSLLDFLVAYATSVVPEDSHQYEGAVNMVCHTLTMMARGGIHDHIAQGFARYSTDDEWHVPHFEKMLYDQGQLAVSYSYAYLLTKDESYADIVRDILLYVSRDLSHPLGGFYSAEDADSHPTHDSKSKREGAFCVWTYDEIQDALGHEKVNDSVSLAVIFSYIFDVRKSGNCDFEKDPHGELRNQNVLIMRTTLAHAAAKFDLTQQQLAEVLERCKKILYDIRQKRPRPHLDNKMVTAWNGLMISGFARAAMALGDSEYSDRAVKAAEFVKEHLYDEENGTLFRSIYAGEERGTLSQLKEPISAFSSDYAFLIQALLDLHEATLDDRWVEWAYHLQEVQDRLFWDSQAGGYFESREGDPHVIIRLKEDQDGAEPTANSVAARNLLRLNALLDDKKYLEKAEKVFSVFGIRLKHIPMALPQMLVALIAHTKGIKQVVIEGKKGSKATRAFVETVHKSPVTNRVIVLADGDKDSFLGKKLEIVREAKPSGEEAKAHICVGQTCGKPTSDPAEIASELANRG